MAAVLAPAMVQGGLAVGARALNFARRNLPEVAEKAQAYFAKQGKDINNMAMGKSEQAQSVVVASLLKSGLPAATFVEDHQLTAKEASVYAQLIAKYHVEQTAAADKAQAAKPSTGDAFLDTVTVNMEIKVICQMLGISSDQYAMLVRGVNTHTSQDIERFQLDRRMRMERPI